MRALRVAACLLVAGVATDVAAEEGPLVQVPTDAQPAPVPELVRPSFPPVTDGSAQAMEAALVTVVRDFCIAGVAGAESDVHVAGRIAANPVPDPWQGQRFMWESPRTTWSLPAVPRLFFWLGAVDNDGFRDCEVLAFEGDRMQLARAALDVIERHAEESGFGAPTYEAWPLEQLGQRGYIDRRWDVRSFGANIAEDRGDPTEIGLQVSVYARAVEQSPARRR